MDYEIKRSPGYGWTDGTFLFELAAEESIAVETTYEFYVSAFELYEVFSDTIHASKIDEEASEKLGAEAEAYILSLLQERVPQVDGAETDVEVYNNEIEKWTLEVKTPKPLHIMLEIEKGDLTKEQRLEQSKVIQQQLNEASIDRGMAEVGYRSVVDGEETYDYVSFTPDRKLTAEDVNLEGI